MKARCGQAPPANPDNPDNPDNPQPPTPTIRIKFSDWANDNNWWGSHAPHVVRRHRWPSWFSRSVLWS